MKSDIHPDYRPVVFQDTTAEFSFITRSTVETSETIEWEDGNTYPLKKVEISSKSHPFYTGTMTIVDTAGRVERFERRYGRRRKEEEGGGEAPAAEATPDAPAEAAAPAAEAVTEAPAEEAVTEAPAEEAAAPEAAAEAPAEEAATEES